MTDEYDDKGIYWVICQMRAIEISLEVMDHHIRKGTLPSNGIHGYYPLTSDYSKFRLAIWIWMNTGKLPAWIHTGDVRKARSPIARIEVAL